jgi:Putative auto-transporter adhesin, head GIN domain
MKTPTHGLVVAGLVVISLTCMVSTASAQTLNISACASQIVLQFNNSLKEPQLVRQGGKTAAQGQLQSTAQGWVLQCAAASNAASATTGKSSGSGVYINRATGPGAVATQNIGGKSTTSRGEEAPPVTVQVPPGWQLLAKAWSGSLRAEGGLWTADVEIASGEMVFSKLQDSRVVVDAGSLSVQEVSGRFGAHLRGAGSIEVAQMRDPALDLQLTGAGSMELKGRAASARIRASGVGSIDVEHVTSEPTIQASGLVTISVGR